MKICRQCGSQYDNDTQSFCPRDGEVLQDNHAGMIGRVLDEQYQIEEFIAEGGMGAVHKDLKPSNIMITNRGIVKLLDLGVAKVSDLGAGGVTSLTVTGQLLGTPYFMSPEQWGESQRDGSEEIDGRTDVYSLGV